MKVLMLSPLNSLYDLQLSKSQLSREMCSALLHYAKQIHLHKFRKILHVAFIVEASGWLQYWIQALTVLWV